MSKPAPEAIRLSKDISGHTFMFPGQVIKTCLYEKIKKLETASVETCSYLRNALGARTSDELVGLLVALNDQTTNLSPSAQIISTQAAHVFKLNREIEDLTAIARGLIGSTVYVVSLEDVKRFGL